MLPSHRLSLFPLLASRGDKAALAVKDLPKLAFLAILALEINPAFAFIALRKRGFFVLRAI